MERVQAASFRLLLARLWLRRTLKRCDCWNYRGYQSSVTRDQGRTCRLTVVAADERMRVVDKLIGCWHLVRSVGQIDGDEVEMEFFPNGQLTYAVAEDKKWQLTLLTFKVRGDTIITNQPSAPSEERTKFAFESDGTLRLESNGSRTWFAPMPSRASAV